MKDFSRSQTVTYTVKVVISRKRCQVQWYMAYWIQTISWPGVTFDTIHLLQAFSSAMFVQLRMQRRCLLVSPNPFCRIPCRRIPFRRMPCKLFLPPFSFLIPFINAIQPFYGCQRNASKNITITVSVRVSVTVKVSLVWRHRHFLCRKISKWHEFSWDSAKRDSANWDSVKWDSAKWGITAEKHLTTIHLT